ncbi:MAG TPA: hypothetical protein DF292_04785 [Firmicutes bacterium]|jgi:uncharacterized membrane protein|nr:hypothetical protein [Bacillota bacterium]HBR24119.1 hypothetical protein [Bacillota bacterium]HCT36334.1 hypothetical protein [Bacillota bacterium]
MSADKVKSKFLSNSELEQVMNAIAEAERATSGEIRVHLESHCDKDPFGRATEVFSKLRMERTALRNGVLIYVAAHDHQFAIIGDQGINDAVSNGFWEATRDAMIMHFKNGRFCEGLCAGLQAAGQALSKYFPYQGTKDVNELSDEISEGH